MKAIKYYVLILLSGLLITLGCETDLDVRAPYERVPIVYGLIDHNDDIHFVKITKLFNGEQDAFEMAAQRDSSELEVVNAKVEEILNDEVINVWDLKDTLITNKQGGDFYAPNQTLYYFKAPNLNTQSEYRLTVDVGTDKPAVATTPLIEDVNVFASSGWSRFIQGVNFYSGDDFIPLEIEVLPPRNAKRVEVNMYFTYCTEYVQGIILSDTVKYELGTKTVNNPDNPKELAFTLPEEVFFTKIINEVPDADTSVVQRVPNIVFFEVVNAAEEFHTYMEVYGPGNTVFQEKPPYTNVENGIGLFSSRVTYNTIDNFNSGSTGFGFGINTLDALTLGSPDDPNFPDGMVEKAFTASGTCP